MYLFLIIFRYFPGRYKIVAVEEKKIDVFERYKIHQTHTHTTKHYVHLYRQLCNAFQ